MKLRRVFWFAYYNLQSPSVRYRGLYPMLFMEKSFGIRAELVVPGYQPKNILRFIRIYVSALLSGKQDLIVIQRVSTNWIYSHALKFLVLLKKNVAYDLDDADYLLTDPSSIYFFAKKSARVIAGSRTIAEHLGQHNRNVTINTSPTPPAFVTKSKRNGKFVVGWIGEFGGEHRESLCRLLFPAVKQLNFPVRLVLMGVIHETDRIDLRDLFRENQNIELVIPENIDWLKEELIQQEISKFDAGIATLTESEFHRSKSGFKVKQYLNNGVPVLCNDLKENNLFVSDGKNGFLCNSSDEFRERMQHLYHLADAEYQNLSESASASAVQFNLEKYCNTLCNLN